jgi:hypothetical protein
MLNRLSWGYVTLDLQSEIHPVPILQWDSDVVKQPALKVYLFYFLWGIVVTLAALLWPSPTFNKDKRSANYKRLAVVPLFYHSIIDVFLPM